MDTEKIKEKQERRKKTQLQQQLLYDKYKKETGRYPIVRGMETKLFHIWKKTFI